MKKYLILSISIVFLGISIIIGTSRIADALLNDGKEDVDVVTAANLIVDALTKETESAQLLSESELVEYLGIQEHQIDSLVPKDGRGIELPYLRIGDQYYFPVSAIDKWLLETEGRAFL
ncbi:hypothetical protein VQL36_09540 [Chengkuizengella sp. SCS-71B]|uniref:hypothetical protein n=1 Tax=Chengkuizengella sp. SCS-71B TaxID=3115290 RepID=UPI0032C21BA5